MAGARRTWCPGRVFRRGLAALAAAGGLLAPQAGIAAEEDYRLISIRTAGRTGVYYFAGGTLCDYINAGRWEHGMRCVSERSNGSIDNLEAIRAGRADFAIVQSDWQFHAVNGTSVFEAAGPNRELRSVMALFPEHLTLVASPESGIVRFEDLRGKRVNLGPVGSGGRGTMRIAMNAMGWSLSDFEFVSELAMDALTPALCSGEIDAAVFIVAHPNLTVEDMVAECDATLVPVEGAGIDRMVGERDYYFTTEIPAGIYDGQVASVDTVALGATMVTSARTSPILVEAFVRTVFENLGSFRQAHPAFANLAPARMVSEGLTAPLHQGALAYLEAAGFLPVETPGQ